MGHYLFCSLDIIFSKECSLGLYQGSTNRPDLSISPNTLFKSLASCEAGRLDERNLCLYQYQEKDKYVKNGKEMPRKTSGKSRRRCLIGYYPTFRGALSALVDRCTEKAGNISELKSILKEMRVDEWIAEQKSL